MIDSITHGTEKVANTLFWDQFLMPILIWRPLYIILKKRRDC
ncbi:hypothetical protein AABM34_12420 [Lysinibacillus fusiformis]